MQMKTALITGTINGIGYEITHKFGTWIII